MAMPAELRVAIEEEDQRCRADVKRVAYEYESHGDVKRLHEELEEVLFQSKDRLRQLFLCMWGEAQRGEAQRGAA